MNADVVFDLHGSSPADLVPYLDTESSELHEARQRAELIRAGMGTYAKVQLAIAEAWARRDWQTLGYDSWDAYLTGEYGEELQRLRLPSGERLVAVADFRQQGMSTRAIASALGVSQSTVQNDLSSGEQKNSPDSVRGTDGKSYASTRPHTPSTPDTTDSPAGQPGPATPGGDGRDSRPAGRPGPGSTSPGDGPEPPAADPSVPVPAHGDSAAGGTLATFSPAKENDTPGSLVPGEADAPKPVDLGLGDGDTYPPCESCGAVIDGQEARAGYARCDDCDPDGEHSRELLPDETWGRCRACHPTKDADPAEPVRLETPTPAGSGEVPADGSAVQADTTSGRPGQPGCAATGAWTDHRHACGRDKTDHLGQHVCHVCGASFTAAEVMQADTAAPAGPGGAFAARQFGYVRLADGRDMLVRAAQFADNELPAVFLTIDESRTEVDRLVLPGNEAWTLAELVRAAHRHVDDWLSRPIPEQTEDDLAEVDEATSLPEDPDVWMATGRRGLPYHKPADDNSTVCGRSMRTGVQLRLNEATGRYEAAPCPRCWPASEPKEQS